MFLLLGMASSIESLVAKLPAPQAEPASNVEQNASEIDQLLALALGLVSLNDTLGKIKQAAIESKPEPAPKLEGARIPLTELLR